AAGNAVLDVLERDALVPRSGKLGTRFMAELESHDVAARGRGLLVGLPFFGPIAPAVVADLREKGMLVGQAGKNVVRIAPPLTISEDDLLGAVPTLAKAVHEAQGKSAAATPPAA
ncbi:MAG: acetylornithine/N-succinyldiaminopimelate aminotransferase, partial [Thermoplasmata archaeon]|nr:acetylornithine/N-succinyldiaminopimelate aminotransferase [Thermoplasmata archaeon]